MVCSHPGRRRVTTPPRAVLSAVSTADLLTVVSTTGNSSVVVHQYVFIVYSHQCRRRGTTPPRPVVSAVRTADLQPDLLPAVSTAGNSFSVVTIHRNFFNAYLHKDKDGGGESFQPRAAVPASSTTGLVPTVSTIALFFVITHRHVFIVYMHTQPFLRQACS